MRSIEIHKIIYTETYNNQKKRWMKKKFLN